MSTMPESADQPSLATDSVVTPAPFIDRRRSNQGPSTGRERRQFSNSYAQLSPEGREFAVAIDRYKFEHGRRFLNCDELLRILRGLGYQRQ
ncbi:MAG: hypothetical protein KatS3mg111_2885 [Pirellulaceae bacterium]|nr:MAG: hypothetical protein KatS3mg111_2885 [Pirellulaceae bacterium]